MKLHYIVIVFCFTSLLITACGENEPEKPQELMDKASYSIGYDLGLKAREDSLALNPDYILMGFKHALNGDSSLISKKELEEVQKEFQKIIYDRQDSKRRKLYDSLEKAGKINKIKSDSFLAKNKEKEDVITTSSGLQYKILKKGSGTIPKEKDIVKFSVLIKDINNNVLDSTHISEPFEMILSEIQIKGWKEGLSLMKPGDKYMFFIPPDLAFGELGYPPIIPPNSAIICEIELISIKK